MDLEDAYPASVFESEPEQSASNSWLYTDDSSSALSLLGDEASAFEPQDEELHLADDSPLFYSPTSSTDASLALYEEIAPDLEPQGALQLVVGDNIPRNTLVHEMMLFCTPNSALSAAQLTRVQNRECFVCDTGLLGKDARAALRHFSTACLGARAAHTYCGEDRAPPTRKDLIIALHTAVLMTQIAVRGGPAPRRLTDADYDLLRAYPNPHLGGIANPDARATEGQGIDERREWWAAFVKWGQTIMIPCKFGCGQKMARKSSVQRHETCVISLSKWTLGFLKLTCSP